MQERFVSGAEPVGHDDVARALLAACRNAAEPVLSAYDQLLSNRAILPSPRLRLRLLRSVCVILREWAMAVLGQKMGTSATGASLILGGTLKLDQTTLMNQRVQDKITSAANRSISVLFKWREDVNFFFILFYVHPFVLFFPSLTMPPRDGRRHIRKHT